MKADWTDTRARAALRRIFDAAVASAAAGPAVLWNLPPRPKGRCVVVGAGKASAAMAAAVDMAWPDVDVSGVVVTRYDHAVPAGRIKILEAAHPVPDAASETAARAILAAVQGLGPDDLVLALISGGGSSLLALPAEGLTLADKQAVNRALLKSGAGITEMNAVRKHLSAIKGGRLALAAAPAKVVSLLISDIPGDDPAAIASGPTLPDPSTIEQVREIVDRYRLDLPPAVQAVLARGDETPKPGDIDVDARLIATPGMALAAAAEAARAEGLTPIVLSDCWEGEARDLGVMMADIARKAAVGETIQRPVVLLSGGEGTVTIGAGPVGRGGRNTEFLLAFAQALAGASDIWAIAGDSDGIDGVEDCAGAVVTPDTLARARAAGLDPAAHLAGHDSATLFGAIGDLVVTGPTLTNVNDIRAVIVT